MMFRGKKGFIGPALMAGRSALGGIVKGGVGLAGRGLSAARGGIGQVSGGLKNRAQQGFQGLRNRGGGQPGQPQPPPQQGPQQPGQGRFNGIRRAGGMMTGLAVGAGGIALGGIKKGHGIAHGFGESIGKKPGFILIIPIILTLLDYLFNINGVPLVSAIKGYDGVLDFLGETILRIGTSAPYWAAVIIYFIVRKPHEKGEWAYPLALFLVGFFTLATAGIGLWVFYHSLFALITFILLLDGFNSEVRISGAHWVFLIVFFMDIFGLATIDALYPDATLEFDDVPGVLGGQSITIPFLFFNRLLFPFWFFFYLFFIQGGKTKTTVSILLTLLYTGITLTSIIGVGAVETTDLEEQTGEAKNAFVKAIDNWRDVIASWLTGRIEYAVTGKVEENEFEPLGVYLENVQSADPRYYEDEDVVVWGTVTARTLDDPININVSCFVQPDIDKYYADKTDPDKKFSVFTLEDNDFACTFNGTSREKGIIEPGKLTIKTFADFNFETLAFLKVYFMNRDRQRAMVRQGLDPFEEFAIEDRSPIAIYTNGPAKIEMGTNNPLISVSKDYIVEPSLDIQRHWTSR